MLQALTAACQRVSEQRQVAIHREVLNVDPPALCGTITRIGRLG